MTDGGQGGQGMAPSLPSGQPLSAPPATAPHGPGSGTPGSDPAAAPPPLALGKSMPPTLGKNVPPTLGKNVPPTLGKVNVPQPVPFEHLRAHLTLWDEVGDGSVANNRHLVVARLPASHATSFACPYTVFSAAHVVPPCSVLSRCMC